MMERGFDDVRRILDRQLGVTGWEISTPRDGWSGTSFIAERAGTRVFVKLDVNPPVLLRLSELGIAPPILKSGLTGERAYVIQEYIAGTYPPQGWFATQFSALATLIRRYQRDDGIKALIGTNQMISRDDIARRTESLVQRLKHASPAFEKSLGWKESISNFFAQVDTLDEISLVFTHGDPSRKNFLLRGDHVYLVDWDEAVRQIRCGISDRSCGGMSLRLSGGGSSLTTACQ